MSYFGNVSSFPCHEFTAAFSRNQALFDARNDFPLFPQSTASHFGHFAETFPILPHILAVSARAKPNAQVIGSLRAHWRGTPRIFRALSNHVCHCEEAIGRRGNPYLKAFPAGEGGSHVSRKCETDEGYLPLPMGEAPGRGGEGSICPLSHFVTAPRVGAKGEARENGLPHQSADWFAMTCVIREFQEYPGDCHTSDVGHWFAMTSSVSVHPIDIQRNPGAARHRGSVIFCSGSPPGRWSRCPGRY